MKKNIFIPVILLSTLCLIALAVILGIIQTKQKPPLNTILPTPTPFKIISPTRSPNILPEELLEAEEEFLKKTPILQKLPYGRPYFDIDYINETHLIIYSKTQNKEGDYEEARKWFAENDIDINSIIIEYK